MKFSLPCGYAFFHFKLLILTRNLPLFILAANAHVFRPLHEALIEYARTCSNFEATWIPSWHIMFVLETMFF